MSKEKIKTLECVKVNDVIALLTLGVAAGKNAVKMALETHGENTPTHLYAKGVLYGAEQAREAFNRMRETKTVHVQRLKK